MKVTGLAPWLGAKRTMAASIIEQLGPHKMYFEPFMGSAAVLMSKPPSSSEIACDLHGDLTNFAWTIQHDKLGLALYRSLRRCLFSEHDFDAARERIGTLPVAESPGEGGVTSSTALRAYYWFVLSWMGRSGFGGAKGVGHSLSIRYGIGGGNQAQRFAGAVESIPAWRRRFRGVTILRRDAVEILDKLHDDPSLAIYADPPYLGPHAAYEHDFQDGDHARLAAALRRFRMARVVISYYDHPQIEKLYPGWTIHHVPTVKRLSTQGKRGATADSAPEVLVINGEVYGQGEAKGCDLFGW